MLSNPTKYTPSYDFSDAQAAAPNSPASPTELDVQFDDIALSIGQTVDALGDVRRSDGALQNGIVTQDSLSVGLVGQITTATAGLVAEAVAAKDGAQAAADTALEAAADLDAAVQVIRTGGMFADWGNFHEEPGETLDWGSFH